MYVVYGTPRNRTFRVLWMLEELAQPYKLVAAMPRSDEVFSRNPSGKVPILEDDGIAICDSVAICTYLADKHGRFTHPAGTIARAHQDSFTQFVVDEIEGALWTAAKHSFVLPEQLRVRDVKAACRFEFEQALERLAKRLGDKQYATGDAFTVPDLLAGHCALWAGAAKFEIPAGPVVGYFGRLHARPAFQRTIGYVAKGAA